MPPILTHRMTQRILVRYYQQDSVEGLRFNYAIDFETETYEKALEYLANIMKTCKGIITSTIIEKIEA